MSDLPIIGVAVKQGDVMIALPAPNRHHNCIRYAIDVLGLTPPIGAGAENQGFYLADGTYLNRTEAFNHVKRIGQKCDPEAHRHLFSEDLW